MDMTGEERIAASRKTVWAALNDVDVLKRCIPGCEVLEKQSPTDMTARVKLQIGPVRATFTGKVKLSDLDPPNGYRISGEGNGGVAGYAKGGAVVRLLEDGSGTLLRYEAKADVGGKLAQLGGRLIDSTARKLAGDFFQTFGAVVGPGAATADAPEPVPVTKDQVRPKAKLKQGGYVAELVASGEAEVAVHQISEIVPVKGVVLVGPLPAEVQNTTVYSAAVSAAARDAAAARALIAHLAGPAAAPVLAAKGMERP